MIRNIWIGQPLAKRVVWCDNFVYNDSVCKEDGPQQHLFLQTNIQIKSKPLLVAVNNKDSKWLMMPRLNVNHHMKWYSRQTNRWSYRPGLPFISIEIGSTSKLDSSAHSIRLLLDSLDFFIFLIFSINLLLNASLILFLMYWFFH